MTLLINILQKINLNKYTKYILKSIIRISTSKLIKRTTYFPQNKTVKIQIYSQIMQQQLFR
jgi:hypothetical protein